jgi:hypothetical protein
MNEQNRYLAVFTGHKDSAARKAWDSLPEAERAEKHRQGISAWKAWAEQHRSVIDDEGGPVGKTKKVSRHGIDDIRNMMGAFTIVRAASPEAAAKLFENHPSFTIFPGDGVEVMPILPIPGQP